MPWKKLDLGGNAEMIVDKINDLSIEPKHQIGKEHIKGLREELDGLKKKIDSKVMPMGGGIVGRDLFKDIDISSQLNGVLKTFNIQGVWRIISVDIDSYPYGAMQKTTDFTNTSTTITFGDSIDVATQLRTGAKCIIFAVLA